MEGYMSLIIPSTHIEQLIATIQDMQLRADELYNETIHPIIAGEVDNIGAVRRNLAGATAKSFGPPRCVNCGNMYAQWNHGAALVLCEFCGGRP
jgi:hypothetical protein